MEKKFTNNVIKRELNQYIKTVSRPVIGNFITEKYLIKCFIKSQFILFTHRSITI